MISRTQICLLFGFAVVTWTPRDTYLVRENKHLSNTSAVHFEYTSFNRRILCKATQEPVRPKTLADVQEVIKSALRNGLTVKPLGNLYSATDIICTDGIPLNLSNINHFSYDTSSGFVTIGAGATLEYLLESLHKFGRSINGIPTYSDITVGGAIATGAHGTNLQSSASISDDIVSLVIVDGLGNVRNVTDPRNLRAFRAHLGLLGVVYDVTLSTIPQYKLYIHNYPQPDNVLWEDNKITELARSTDRFQFFWFPTSRQVVMSVGHRVPVTTRGSCHTNFISEGSGFIIELVSQAWEGMQNFGNHLGFFVMQQIMKMSLFQRIPIRSPIFSFENSNDLCNPAVGFSHKISANGCKRCAWNNGINRSLLVFEMSAIIPLSELHEAIKTMKNILDEFPVEFPLSGIYFRFLSASEGLLTVNSGRPSVAIEWILVPRRDRFKKPMLGLPVFQALMQALVQKHEGRPHLGKNGLLYTQRDVLLRSYPKLPTFVKEMEEFDPKGVFLNDFGRRLRFGTTKTSMDSSVKHCALVDNCVCTKDGDCGDGSNFCGTVKGYRVCREREENYQGFMRKILKYL